MGGYRRNAWVVIAEIRKMFNLSLCYGDGQTKTYPYDKMEYCAWKEDVAVWDVQQVTEEIINDIEGAVPALLRKE